MLRFIAKTVLLALLAIVIYHGAKVYLTFRFAMQTERCSRPSDLAKLDSASISSAEKQEISARLYACVKGNQSVVDRLFFRIPESWAQAQSSP